MCRSSHVQHVRGQIFVTLLFFAYARSAILKHLQAQKTVIFCTSSFPAVRTQLPFHNTSKLRQSHSLCSPPIPPMPSDTLSGVLAPPKGLLEYRQLWEPRETTLMSNDLKCSQPDCKAESPHEQGEPDAHYQRVCLDCITGAFVQSTLRSFK